MTFDADPQYLANFESFIQNLDLKDFCDKLEIIFSLCLSILIGNPQIFMKAMRLLLVPNQISSRYREKIISEIKVKICFNELVLQYKKDKN